MKYEYKTHAAYRGYGWIEPLMDSEDPLIEEYLARRICEELNALQSECERLRKDVASLVEALEMARDRLESERRSGEFDPLIRDIDDALVAYRKGGE